jgi:hypothetical protein
MRKCHVDYFIAVNQLLNAVYTYNQEDYKKLLIALRNGSFNSKKYTDQEIATLKTTKYFQKHYSKYL